MAKDITTEVAELLQGRSVLVIDDQRLSRHIVCRFFSGTDCAEPVQAKDGAEGLAALAEQGDAIGAVVCDFNMPGFNGLELLKAVRTGFNGIRNDLPVIMLTGNSDGRLVALALALDVDAFLVKPIAQRTLMSRLRYVLGTQKSVKSPAEYQSVDIEHAMDVLNTPAAPAPSQAPKGRAVALEDVPVPCVLAEPIHAPTGDLLLAAGVTLTRRLADRLLELRDMGFPLATVYIVV
jgi:two-component system chemotaxis response regulator CheY